jgi:ABC-type bacteriocin/lantibiotic exporter with double-glycine peptidase domain
VILHAAHNVHHDGVVWYWSLLPHNLILDAFVAAVLLMILGLTSLFFIQALVDSVFIPGRKPALKCLGSKVRLDTLARACFFGLRSYLLPHLSQRIDAERVPGQHSHPLGLPLTLNHVQQKAGLGIVSQRLENILCSGDYSGICSVKLHPNDGRAPAGTR